MSTKIRVWDVPTRVFHWTLVLSFAGAFLTSESERYRDIHVLLGYTMLGLVAFRLVWGFIGTRYARFSSFLYSPWQVFDYMRDLFRGRTAHYVGHNPAGSVAIWLLLSLAVAAGISGLLLFQQTGGDAMEEMHEALSFAMLAVVVVHVAGVAVSSLLHRENLVRAMITGNKQGESGQGAMRSYAWLGVIMLAAVVVFWTTYDVAGAAASGEVAAHHEADDD